MKCFSQNSRDFWSVSIRMWTLIWCVPVAHVWDSAIVCLFLVEIQQLYAYFLWWQDWLLWFWIFDLDVAHTRCWLWPFTTNMFVAFYRTFCHNSENKFEGPFRLAPSYLQVQFFFFSLWIQVVGFRAAQLCPCECDNKYCMVRINNHLFFKFFWKDSRHHHKPWPKLGHKTSVVGNTQAIDDAKQQWSVCHISCMTKSVLLQAAWHELRDNRPGAFQLYGFDFMLDTDMRTWLLEARFLLYLLACLCCLLILMCWRYAPLNMLVTVRPSVNCSPVILCRCETLYCHTVYPRLCVCFQIFLCAAAAQPLSWFWVMLITGEWRACSSMQAAWRHSKRSRYTVHWFAVSPALHVVTKHSVSGTAAQVRPYLRHTISGTFSPWAALTSLSSRNPCACIHTVYDLEWILTVEMHMFLAKDLVARHVVFNCSDAAMVVN